MNIAVQNAKLDYFMEDERGQFAGLHFILDLYSVDNLDNLKWIEFGLLGAAKAGNATVLKSYMHHFGVDQGVSGVLVLSESHISVHSWPEIKYIALDIFMCGKAKPKLAVEFLLDYFKPAEHKVSSIRRGGVDE